MGESKRRKLAGHTDPKPKKTMSTEERKKIVTQAVTVAMSDMVVMYKDLMKEST